MRDQTSGDAGRVKATLDDGVVEPVRRCRDADPDRMGGAVTDLRAAVEIGLEQGSLVLALRAASDLARVPPKVRPADWRSVLRSVYDVLPAGVARSEILDARAHLDA